MPGHRPAVAPTTTNSQSVARGWERHRQRQVERLAALAQLRAVYGTAADLRPSPAGPSSCPPSCGYCNKAVVA
jgi:hypothetical protein